MRKNQDDHEILQDDEFEVQTKFPQPGQVKKHMNLPVHPPTGNFSSNAGNKKDYSPLKWEEYFDELFYIDEKTSVFRAGQDGAIFFCIHGAGHSALSFALLGKQVKNFGTLVAYDIKGHGYSKETQNLEDMSIQSLVTEGLEVLDRVVEKYPDHNIVMVGHSLGGSVCVRVTDQALQRSYKSRIQGMVIIDVVQGTALEALPFMTSILDNRPKGFKTLQKAIEWSIVSQTLRKLQSARVSIPPQITITENVDTDKKYVWKVELKDTQKYWPEWFKGLSKMFIDTKLPKLLVTAQRQRLDKELIVAQMQGRFKLCILNHVGHSVQQDDPKGTARLLYDFLYTFRIPQNKQDQNLRQEIGIAKFHPNLKQYK